MICEKSDNLHANFVTFNKRIANRNPRSSNKIRYIIIHIVFDFQELIKHIHDKTAPRTGPLRLQMCRADREGMFMTECLQKIFFCPATTKQRKYRMEREAFIRDELEVVDIPYRSFCACEVRGASK